MGRRLALCAFIVCLVAAMVGCHAIDFYSPSLQAQVSKEMEPPRELAMASLPAYRIEPPDTLQLGMVKLVPRPSYRLDSLDVLYVSVLGVPEEQPINDYYTVDEDGLVRFGPVYGVVRVKGLTIEQAAEAIRRSLRFVWKDPVVSVQLVRSNGVMELNGEYVVQPDGAIGLHNYGQVNVSGKTIVEARLAVQEHLSQYFDSPLVSVDVVGYNSAAYFVVIASRGAGEEILRYPVTGNETVLDAVGQVRNLSNVSSKTMWVARPAPDSFGAEQVLPVNWDAIARGGQTGTNYQILPGDRLYIVDDQLVAADDFISRFTRPIERLLSIGQLTSETVRSTQVLGRSYNSSRNN